MITRNLQLLKMFLVLFCVSIAGCAQSINWNDPLAIANKVEIRKDDFKKVTSFIGPNCALDEPSDTLMLRAFKGRENSIEYQIYVADEYLYEIIRGGSGWRYYSSAHDSDGNSLGVTVIARQVDWCGSYKCSYVEILGLGVTREYLEERKARGITFKISGKNGEEVFSIPATYVQAFLSVAK